MSNKTKSKKYQGVYWREGKKGEVTYYICYRAPYSGNDPKKIGTTTPCWETIGRKDAGITETYCKSVRDKRMNEIRLGEEPPKAKKKRLIHRKTLNDLASLYFEERSDAKDAKHAQQRFNKWFPNTLGKEALEDINIHQIRELREEMAETLAPKTLNNLFALSRAIWTHGIDREHTSIANPFAKLKRLPIDNERLRYLNKSESDLLLNKVKESPTLWLFCALSLTTGGRLATILSIKKRHIHFENKTISLLNHKAGRTYLGHIHPIVENALRDRCKHLKADDNIFLEPNGIAPSTRAIQGRLRPILNKLFNVGIPEDDRQNRVVIHTLRHSFASNLVARGTDLYVVKELMDHATIKVTERYAHLAPNAGKSHVERLFS